MTPAQLYEFDLNGYIVIRGALAPDLLREANAVADDYEARAGLDLHGERRHGGEPCRAWRYDRMVLEHEVFERLTMSPKLVSWLPWLLPWPRLRSTWLDYKALNGGIGHHANHTPYDPINAYHFQDGRIRAMSIDAMYALHDIPEDGGALEVIPGSHKANFALPDDHVALGALRRAVALRAGECLLFSHDLNHGSLNRRDYVRRAFFTSFAPGCFANVQGDSRLYAPLFERARPGGWRRYLLRDVHGAWNPLEPPRHAVEDELEIDGDDWRWREEPAAAAVATAR